LPRVTVIVPIFNGVEFLQAFFGSLAGALPYNSELILVHDGSTQPVWDTVPEFEAAESVVRLRNEANLGYCAAVNRAFPLATGDIVVQLNTDLILDPDCIQAMVGLIEREKNVGIVGSKLVFPTTGLVQHVGMALGNHTKPHVFLEMPTSHPLCGKTRKVQIVTGATAAMTRGVLDKVGPFDERYFNHNEDIDHCLLARKHGFHNFLCADSVAHHWESQSGPARFAGVESAEALFWSRWGPDLDSDLGLFVDEALDHVLKEAPQLEGIPFEILDLSRGADQPIVLDSLSRRWPDVDTRIRHYRQASNHAARLHLPLLLPHWVAQEPIPFIYLVDRYRELSENDLWFANRHRVVAEEFVIDLTGAALLASELGAAG
jgi:GT2 family glycosyltransferase